MMQELTKSTQSSQISAKANPVHIRSPYPKSGSRHQIRMISKI